MNIDTINANNTFRPHQSLTLWKTKASRSASLTALQSRGQSRGRGGLCDYAGFPSYFLYSGYGLDLCMISLHNDTLLRPSSETETTEMVLLFVRRSFLRLNCDGNTIVFVLGHPILKVSIVCRSACLSVCICLCVFFFSMRLFYCCGLSACYCLSKCYVKQEVVCVFFLCRTGPLFTPLLAHITGAMCQLCMCHDSLVHHAATSKHWLPA